MENPWLNLPDKPDFILPVDFELIRHHSNFKNLELGSLPGQFAGGLDSAKVLLLALNPGHSVRDVIEMQIPVLKESILNNHLDPYGSPFYFFDEQLANTAGHEWWERILKFLLLSGVTAQTLRKNMMLVEYFPYHSLAWKDLPEVPSQKFAFNIVSEAMKRNKIIIIMRKEQFWYEAVLGLQNYKNKMVVNNPRQPYISTGNLGKANFNSLLAELT